MIKPDLTRFSRKLGYTFKQMPHLKRALSHCSVGADNNERLEFLGDSILNCVIARELYVRFPEQPEGQLSRLRAHLVKGDTLAEVANELELGNYLFLGQGELKSGGFRRASILADALEAVFAAIFVDSDFETAQSVIVQCFQSRLQSETLLASTKDNKTMLQECLQALKLPLPKYILKNQETAADTLEFIIESHIPNTPYKATGKGATRRRAEQDAAKKLLEWIKCSR